MTDADWASSPYHMGRSILEYRHPRSMSSLERDEIVLAQGHQARTGKIVLWSTEFPPGPGGIGTHAYQVAMQLTRRSWQVIVLSPQDYVPLAEAIAFNHDQPFRIVKLTSRLLSPLKIAGRLARSYYLIAREKPDLILASGYAATLMAVAVSWMLRLPLVIVTHGHELLMPPRFMGRLMRSAFSRAQQVVAVSDFAKRNALQSGIRPEALTVIPNGADSEHFFPLLQGPSPAARLGINGNPVLLTVGNLSQRKAQDVVIRGLPWVIQHFPEVEYVMVGKPTLRAEYEKLAEELGVRAHIHFVGIAPTSELRNYYHACDVFVLVSRIVNDWNGEGLGIVALEAALCGKPAVVTRGCGLEEAVVEGQTGLLVEMNNPQETAQAIIRLLTCDDVRRRMGEKARERAIKKWTWEKRVEQYGDLLVDVENGQTR